MLAATCAFLSLAQLVELGRPPTQTFVAPGNLYSVEIPKTWTVQLTSQPHEIRYVPNGDGSPLLTITRFAVPAGANPRQLALIAIETRLQKMPRYQLVGKTDVNIGGLPGTSLVVTYAYQGNIQYPRAIEELYVVAGEEAFAFHFDCFQPVAGNYAQDLTRLYQSFVVRPTAKEDKVFESKKSAAPELEGFNF